MTDDSKMIDIYNNPIFNFISIPLPRPSNLFFSAFRILKFTLNTIRALRGQIESCPRTEKSVIIAIGSFYEALVIYIYRLFFDKPFQKYIVWLRGIWGKEIRARHNGLLHSIIVNLERRFLNSADKIIANGPDTAVAYEKLGFQSIVIENAIDLEKYKLKRNRSQDIFTISYVGRLSKEKGLLDFIESIKLFNLTYPQFCRNISFEIVGDGPLRNEVLKSKFGNLTYLGPLSNDKMPEYLNTIHAGVALTYSRKEIGGAGVSNGLLELMASGKIVICWRNIIFQQVLDEKSCLMVEEGKVAELVLAYLYFIEAPLEIEKMTLRANSIVKEYSFDNHMSKFIEVLNEN